MFVHVNKVEMSLEVCATYAGVGGAVAPPCPRIETVITGGAFECTRTNELAD